MATRKRREPTRAEIAQIESEIARIRSLGSNNLRAEWRAMFKRAPPKALTKDLLARMMCFRIQQEVYGGFDRATLKLLDSYAKGKPAEADRVRRLKPGTELVREYQGECHKVIIVEEGFVWNGKTYASLTSIAREIAGTGWSGPRFFGLRGRGGDGATVSAAMRAAADAGAA
jgi:hypothetical protein